MRLAPPQTLVATGIPLSQAIGEYLQWLELTKRRSLRTVAEFRADLARFAAFGGGDAGVPDVAGIDRELLDGYRKHVARLTVIPGASGCRSPPRRRTGPADS